MDDSKESFKHWELGAKWVHLKSKMEDSNANYLELFW